MHKNPAVTPMDKAPIPKKNIIILENNIAAQHQKVCCPVPEKPQKSGTLTPITQQCKAEDIVKKVLEVNK